MESTSNTKNVVSVPINRKKATKHKLEQKEHPRVQLLEQDKKKLIDDLKREKERNHQLEGRVSELEALYSDICDQKEELEDALEEVYDKYKDIEKKYKSLLEKRSRDKTL